MFFVVLVIHQFKTPHILGSFFILLISIKLSRIPFKAMTVFKTSHFGYVLCSGLT